MYNTNTTPTPFCTRRILLIRLNVLHEYYSYSFVYYTNTTPTPFCTRRIILLLPNVLNECYSYTSCTDIDTTIFRSCIYYNDDDSAAIFYDFLMICVNKL